MIKNSIFTAFAIVSLAFLEACSTPAPPYAVSIPNVQALKAATTTGVAVDEFTAQPSASNQSISIRANSMVSASGTFSKYLQNALIQELTDARLLDPKSTIHISAVLTKNDISAAGFITNTAEIEARFTVTRDGKPVFDKVKYVTTKWDSNFIGAIAIPRAMQNYPNVVTELLKELYADKDFIAALNNK